MCKTIKWKSRIVFLRQLVIFKMLRIVLWDFRCHAMHLVPVVIEETTTTMAGSAEEEEASAEEESGQPVPNSPKFRLHNPKKVSNLGLI
jgi:hypothetical protein